MRIGILATRAKRREAGDTVGGWRFVIWGLLADARRSLLGVARAVRALPLRFTPRYYRRASYAEPELTQ